VGPLNPISTDEKNSKLIRLIWGEDFQAVYIFHARPCGFSWREEGSADRNPVLWVVIYSDGLFGEGLVASQLASYIIRYESSWVYQVLTMTKKEMITTRDFKKIASDSARK
jgi:hypothetical protein